MHLTGTPGPCHQEKLFGAFQSPSPRPPTDTPSEQQPPCVWPPTHAPGELRARWPLPAEGRTPLCPDSQPQSRSRDQLRARHMGSSPTETRQGHPLRWEKPRALAGHGAPRGAAADVGHPGPVRSRMSALHTESLPLRACGLHVFAGRAVCPRPADQTCLKTFFFKLETVINNLISIFVRLWP